MKPKGGSRGIRHMDMQACPLDSLHAEIKDEPHSGVGCEADAEEGTCPPRWECED